MRALKLKKGGSSQYKIAKELGVSFEAVSQWMKNYREEGKEGLRSKGNPGPKSKISEKHRKELKAAIIKGPQAFGYKTGVWTLERIRKLVKKISKKDYGTTQIWRVVISLGFTCQKPELRVKERKEKQIKNWKLKEFPVLKKMGARE